MTLRRVTGLQRLRGRVPLAGPAVDRHRRAAAAREGGRFRDEIVPLQVKGADGAESLFADDEGIRPDTTAEKLAAQAG